MLKIAVEVPPAASAGEWLADVHAMEAAGAAAVLLPEDAPGREALLAALAAVTSAVAIDGRGAGEAVAWLARGRLLDPTAMAEWPRLPEPESREQWQALCAEAEAAGAEGVVVRHCATLLDLLRNPDRVDDRSDLRLAQG